MSITREEYNRHKEICSTNFKQMNDKLDAIKDQLTALPGKLTEKFDERYASKKVEKTLIKILSILLGFGIAGFVTGIYAMFKFLIINNYL